MEDIRLVLTIVQSAIVLIGIPLGAYKWYITVDNRDKRQEEKLVELSKRLDSMFTNISTLNERLLIVERDDFVIKRDMAGLQDSFDKVMMMLNGIQQAASILRDEIHRSDKSTSTDLARIKERLRIEEDA